jgi:hypothetical protein
VELAVELDELHRTVVTHEDRERDRPEVLAGEPARGRCDGRDRRRSAPSRDAVPVHDVLGLHLRPHVHVQAGKLAPHLAELRGESALGGVDRGGLVEQRVDLGPEPIPVPRRAKDAATALRVLYRLHDELLRRARTKTFDRGKLVVGVATRTR